MVGTLDDLERPLADFGQRRGQLVARIAAIGKDMAQLGEAVADAGEHIGRAVTVLHIGGHTDRNRSPACLHDDFCHRVRNPREVQAIARRLIVGPHRQLRFQLVPRATSVAHREQVKNRGADISRLVLFRWE